MEKPSPNLRLSEMIHSQCESIMRTWLTRLRVEIAAAEGQTDEYLIDHAPRLLRSIATALSAEFNQESLLEVLQNAKAHGAQRTRSSYSTSDVISEYLALRETVFDRVSAELPLTPKQILNLIRIFEGGLGVAVEEFTLTRNQIKSTDDSNAKLAGYLGSSREKARLRARVESSASHETLVAERTLAEAKEDLKLVADAVTTIIIRLDLDFRYIFVNRAYETLFGRPSAAVIGKSIEDFITPDLRSVVYEHLGRAVSGDQASFEYVLTNQQGEKRHMLFTFVPARDPREKIVGVVLTLQDIEQQKRAEFDAQERRRELSNVFSQAPTPIALMMGPEHVFTLANPPYVEFIGRNPTGRKVRSVFTEDEAGAFFALLDQVYTTGVPFIGTELPFRRTDSNGKISDLKVNFAYHPYRLASGEVAGILAFVFDVTDQVLAREAVQASESQLRSVFAHASVGFAISDLEGHFIDVNPRFCEITGYSTEELKKMQSLDIIHTGDLQKDRVKLDELRTGVIDSFIIEKRFIKKTGQTVWVRNSVSLLPRPGAEPFIIRVAEDVTAVREAERQRRESEERFITLADSMPQIVWTANPDGGLDYFNQGWFDYSGTTYEQNVGDGWASQVHPEDLPIAVERWTKSLASGDAYETEFRLRKADGSYRWFVARATASRDRNGRIAKWYGTNTDIHDSKIVNQQLAQTRLNLESEQAKFRTLVADANTPIAVLHGPDLVYEIANDSYLNLFENRSLIGKPLMQALPELEGQKFPELLKRAYETGEVYREAEALALLRRTEDGVLEERFFDQSYTPIYDAAGKPYGVYIQALHVTERVLARRQLEETAERLTMAIEAANMGTWELDPRTGHIQWSDRTRELFGVPRLGVTPLSLALERIHPDDQARVATAIEKAIDPYGDRTYDIEYRINRLDGETNWVSLRGKSFFVETPAGRLTTRFTGTVLDVTERILAEVALRDAKERAELASAAKSSFLANMSHEIRTPLGAIMGFVSLIRDEAVTQKTLNEYVNVIERNSTQLMRIIDDILDLSKVEAGMMLIEHIDFSLIELLSDFASLMGFRARERGIIFELKARSELPDLVTSDPTRIRQILTNIVGNAIKFTDEGLVTLTVGFEDNELTFAVEDTGRGISPEQVSLLFQPFSQADPSTTRKFGGTGLGLVLTRRLAEALGGAFVLTSSQIGKGSLFTATLIVQRPVGSHMMKALGFASEPARNATVPALLSGLKILLVEDSPDNQALFSIYLNRAGATIDIASDGQRGSEMALKGSYDVVLMDVQMPIMDGITAVRHLRAKSYEGPIIALTAHAMKEERVRCLEAGYTGFLSKPIQRGELINALTKYRPD